ncbi:helix-turn-helix domain-containing protein [Edaphovirga cremea]|uniref:helix-turn-helix domain-containing protein n=1 Tax=Edaphovirga cremea TaxID=2267246 RepID=UPI003989AD9C
MRFFSERLKQERVKLGLAASKMAAIGGVSINTQFRYENGERTPRIQYLMAVAVRGVDVFYLLTGRRVLLCADSLDSHEADVLMAYRTMPEEDQAALHRIATACATQMGSD